MKNEIIEIQNTVEAFDKRMISMQQQIQDTIDIIKSANTRIESDNSLHTISEVSTITGLSSYFIKKDIKQKRLKSTQRGSRDFVREDDLNEYIKS